MSPRPGADITHVTAHEQRRLAALHEYLLLDAPAGDELEAVVRVAAMVAGVPTATVNLIDANRAVGRMQRLITYAHAGNAPCTGHDVGLATCERIVGRHGGRIAGETPGGGTTVTFTMPAAAESSAPAGTASNVVHA
jgi:hypothetical protein